MAIDVALVRITKYILGNGNTAAGWRYSLRKIKVLCFHCRVPNALPEHHHHVGDAMLTWGNVRSQWWV